MVGGQIAPVEESNVCVLLSGHGFADIAVAFMVVIAQLTANLIGDIIDLA